LLRRLHSTLLQGLHPRLTTPLRLRSSQSGNRRDGRRSARHQPFNRRLGSNWRRGLLARNRGSNGLLLCGSFLGQKGLGFGYSSFSRFNVSSRFSGCVLGPDFSACSH
jgi:hypothetical protein